MKQLPPDKRKFAARMRNTTNERFWDALNILLTRSYAAAERHYAEAMSSIPGLTSTQKSAVIAKATEIRELWDGMNTITMDNTTEEELINGNL